MRLSTVIALLLTLLALPLAQAEDFITLPLPTNKGKIKMSMGLGSVKQLGYAGRGLLLQGGFFNSDQFVMETGYLLTNGLQGSDFDDANIAAMFSHVKAATVIREANFSALMFGLRLNGFYYPSSFHFYVRAGFSSWTLSRVNSYRATMVNSQLEETEAAILDKDSALLQLTEKYPSDSLSGFDLYGGVGFDYFVTESMLLGVDFTKLQAQPGRVNMLGLTFGYLF
ncbi:MAG: hypothetical protein HQL49_09250 [Gammaproteobacteria bacterium]|nr:hypothetical protein [Gammaproteobacteria bacterium]